MTARQLPGRVEHTRANGPGKRLIDVILAGAALLFIWPLLAVLGLVVRASSAGPRRGQAMPYRDHHLLRVFLGELRGHWQGQYLTVQLLGDR